MIYWTSALRCIEENKASSTYSSPPKLQYFSLLQGLKKMEWKMPYLFLTTPLSIRSISWACHLQNRQLASISPRSTTWPFDLASANGFTCFIDQEWGRWHNFALSVSTKNESDATKIDVVIACIALRSSSLNYSYLQKRALRIMSTNDLSYRQALEVFNKPQCFNNVSRGK